MFLYCSIRFYVCKVIRFVFLFFFFLIFFFRSSSGEIDATRVFVEDNQPLRDSLLELQKKKSVLDTGNLLFPSFFSLSFLVGHTHVHAPHHVTTDRFAKKEEEMKKMATAERTAHGYGAATVGVTEAQLKRRQEAAEILKKTRENAYREKLEQAKKEGMTYERLKRMEELRDVKAEKAGPDAHYVALREAAVRRGMMPPDAKGRTEELKDKMEMLKKRETLEKPTAPFMAAGREHRGRPRRKEKEQNQELSK